MSGGRMCTGTAARHCMRFRAAMPCHPTPRHAMPAPLGLCVQIFRLMRMLRLYTQYRQYERRQQAKQALQVRHARAWTLWAGVRVAAA